MGQIKKLPLKDYRDFVGEAEQGFDIPVHYAVTRDEFESGATFSGQHGGVISGPSSGYTVPFTFHGKERITPISSSLRLSDGGSNRSAEPVTVNFNIGGNLIGDKQTFDDFAEQIDYAINKRNKRVYA